MDMKFVKVKYVGKKNTENNEKIKDYIEGTGIKDNATIAIFSSVQFLDVLHEVSDYLSSYYNIVIFKPKRAFFKGQILGCDSYYGSLEIKKKIDMFLYIGDGYFHPLALLYAQENLDLKVPVVIYNIIDQRFEVIDDKVIEQNLKKRKANLAKFYFSSNIGVFISSKWGQEKMLSLSKIKDTFKDKKIYFFVADNFSSQEMDNFAFIDCFVNTACPRIGQDDVVNFTKPIVNLNDIVKD